MKSRMIRRDGQMFRVFYDPKSQEFCDCGNLFRRSDGMVISGDPSAACCVARVEKLVRMPEPEVKLLSFEEECRWVPTEEEAAGEIAQFIAMCDSDDALNAGWDLPESCRDTADPVLADIEVIDPVDEFCETSEEEIRQKELVAASPIRRNDPKIRPVDPNEPVDTSMLAFDQAALRQDLEEGKIVPFDPIEVEDLDPVMPDEVYRVKRLPVALFQAAERQARQ